MFKKTAMLIACLSAIGALAVGCAAPTDDADAEQSTKGEALGGTVGAPSVSCWVPITEESQAIIGACANGFCEQLEPAGFGVCYNGVVMVPITLAPNNVCIIPVPGELPGSALTRPATFYNPADPYQPPPCAPVTPPPPPAPIPVPIRPLPPRPIRPAPPVCRFGPCFQPL